MIDYVNPLNKLQSLADFIGTVSSFSSLAYERVTNQSEIIGNVTAFYQQAKGAIDLAHATYSNVLAIRDSAKALFVEGKSVLQSVNGSFSGVRNWVRDYCSPNTTAKGQIDSLKQQLIRVASNVDTTLAGISLLTNAFAPLKLTATDFSTQLFNSYDPLQLCNSSVLAFADSI
jgi:hypothetical protein